VQLSFPGFLADCRRNFGPPPRQFRFWDRVTYLRLPRPTWLERTDKLIAIYDRKRELYVEGEVVWGVVIQANRLLNSAGGKNHPGELVYPLSTGSAVRPNDLGEIAARLAGLKYSAPANPELGFIAHYLTDQRIRVLALPVPRSISPYVECAISTTMFFRHHLPGRILSCPLLPIVVANQPPRIAIPLPGRYWPESFTRWWNAWKGAAK
jgi:hypothetical protein